MPVVSTPVKKRPFHDASPASTRSYMRAGVRRGGRAVDMTPAAFASVRDEATIGVGLETLPIDLTMRDCSTQRRGDRPDTSGAIFPRPTRGTEHRQNGPKHMAAQYDAIVI